jgi:hypothetical protein
MITSFSQLNNGSVEHVGVEYHVAESFIYPPMAAGDLCSSGSLSIFTRWSATGKSAKRMKKKVDFSGDPLQKYGWIYIRCQ